jgi:Uncharacterized protein conserved in bacteria
MNSLTISFRWGNSTLQNGRENIANKLKANDIPLKEILDHNPVDVLGDILVGIITAIVLAE